MTDRGSSIVSSTRNVGVVISAAGSSSRFGGGDKLAAMLDGRSVLARSIDAFVALPSVAAIVVAISPTLPAGSALAEEIDRLRLTDGRVRFVAAGGASRAETVANAMGSFDSSCEWVAVHDGARPLASREMIERVLTAAFEYGAAAPAIQVTSTIKLAGPTLPTQVERTVPRSRLWAMQTPQAMRPDVLLEAISGCPVPLGQVTDDAQLLELAGVPVTLIAGEERNLKITTKLDLELARLLLASAL